MGSATPAQRNKMRTRIIFGALVGILFLIGCAGIILSTRANESAKTTDVIRIVAAENVWGDLARQIGGTRVHIYSVVSDPNADPHEYASTNNDARAVENANYVILNGAGYDGWMSKLLGAGGNDKRVLNIADLLNKKEGDNPHFWYDPEYVNAAALQILHDMVSLDPNDADYFQANYATLVNSLAVYQGAIENIKMEYRGEKVGATEDIFFYLAKAAGLDLTTSPAFMEAVAEGNDPPAISIAALNDQINAKQIRILVYNIQTETPITESLVTLANHRGVGVVGMSELPTSKTISFQDWMHAEVLALQAALREGTSHDNE
jgi:zinc/manganese transport system substrate-binding protein